MGVNMFEVLYNLEENVFDIGVVEVFVVVSFYKLVEVIFYIFYSNMKFFCVWV